MFGRIKPHIVQLLILTFAVWAVYAGALQHHFLDNWDDQFYVVENPVIRAFTLEHLRTAFSKYYLGNYAPLHIISYMLDYSLWGMKPFGFIFSNLLLHTFSTLFFYAMLVRLSFSRTAACLAALLFAGHPVQVESVVWVSQRKNLLAMFFLLGAFHLYLSTQAAEGSRRLLFFAASLVAFIAALLSKSVAVVFPIMLLAYDYCCLPPLAWRRGLRNKLPYLAAALLVGLIALVSQDLNNNGGRVPYHGGSPLVTFYTMLTVYARYLETLVYPWRLSAVYGLPLRLTPDWTVVLSGIALLFSIVIGVVLCRRRNPLAFWYLLFFIGLLPVSNIIPIVTLMNDRYLYFPMLGVSAAFGLFGDSAVFRLKPTRVPWRLFAGIMLIAVALISARERTRVWHDSIALWSDTASKTAGGSGYDLDVKFATLALADSYVHEGDRCYERGDREGGRRMYLAALSQDPTNYAALGQLGGQYVREGKPLLGRQYLLKLTETFKRSAIGFQELGLSYVATGEWGSAVDAFEHAVELEPRNPDYRRYLNTAREYLALQVRH